jgi:NADH dehydrogenase
MILVTGGTGVLGSVLVSRLSQAGHKVRVLCLNDDPGLPRINNCGAEIIYGDISDPSVTNGICKDIDTVYHLAAVIVTNNESLYLSVNINGTQNIVNAALAGGVRHFIHISSASVTYPRPTPYSLSKIRSEEIVCNSGLGFTIIRPTLVYDSLGGQEFNMFLSYLDKFPVIPFIGSGNAIKRPVFSGDIIQGLVNLYKQDITIGKTYNFSGPDRISMIDFSRLCLCLMGIGGRKVIHLPVFVCKAMSWALNRVMQNPPLRWPVIAGVTQDADLDPAEAIKDIGYSPERLYEKLPGCFPR